jgi:hypothetical protein
VCSSDLLKAARGHLEACLALNPRHEECLHFENFIKRRKPGGGKA